MGKQNYGGLSPTIHLHKSSHCLPSISHSALHHTLSMTPHIFTAFAHTWSRQDPHHGRRQAGPMTSPPVPDSETSLRENGPKVIRLISARTGARHRDLAGPMSFSFYSNNMALCKYQRGTTVPFQITCRVYSWDDMKV